MPRDKRLVTLCGLGSRSLLREHNLVVAAKLEEGDFVRPCGNQPGKLLQNLGGRVGMYLLSILLTLLEYHVFEDVEQVVDPLAVELGVFVCVGV